MAVQRQALHGDVPTYSAAASATVASHGTAWAPSPDAPYDVRRGPRSASCTWICLRVSSIWLPRPDGTTDDAWNGPSPAWSVHPRTLHAAYALPYAPTKRDVPLDTDGSDASSPSVHAPAASARDVPPTTKRRGPPSVDAAHADPVARAPILPPPEPATAARDAVPDDDAPARPRRRPAPSVRPLWAAAPAGAYGRARLNVRLGSGCRCWRRGARTRLALHARCRLCRASLSPFASDLTPPHHLATIIHLHPHPHPSPSVSLSHPQPLPPPPTTPPSPSILSSYVPVPSAAPSSRYAQRGCARCASRS
ncbi:hypothetical protein C8Q70DRAFT_673658 [Cubamyces menziesii]|nr:hypothetical protein C8Q70DRAFT_673658 [Cubamyces menziesii]